MADSQSLRQVTDTLGSETLGTLFAALRTLQVHHARNDAVAGTAKKLSELLTQIHQAMGPSQVVFLEEDVYLNGNRVRVLRHELPRYVALVRDLKRLGVVRFDVGAPPSIEDTLTFLESLVQTPEGVPQVFCGALTVEFARDRAARIPEHLIDRRQYALRVYSKALLFLKDALEQLKSGHAPPVRKAKRLVQDLVDIASADIVPLLGLASIRDHADIFFHHSVNVTILSVVFGQRLGMSKQALAELGMAALLHDIGKFSLPREVLYKEGPLSEGERKLLDQIPRETLRVLLKHSLVSRGHPVQLILAYEHHLVRSLADYVRVFGQRSLYYQTQILAITNFFDALTTARPQRGPYLPDHALQLIAAQANKKFDPVMVRLFTNVIGVYPLGSMVELDDGSMGVVVHTSSDEPRRPLVKLAMDAQRKRFAGPYLDLAAPDAKLKILGSVNPYEFGINPMSYLMGS